MLKVTLANLAAHKRRLLSTFAAVLLGVAFLSGVLIETTTLGHQFDTLFDTGSAQVDAVVRNDRSTTDDMGNTFRPPIPDAVLARVRAVPGVRLAQPDWTAPAVVVGADGKAIGSMGPPQLGYTWHDDPALTAYRLVDGQAPRASSEVVIDRSTAEKGRLRVGSRTTVLTPKAIAVTVTGIARYGDQDSAAGTTAVFFDEAGARAHLHPDPPAGMDRILVAAQPDTDDATLVHALDRAAGAGTETLSRAEFRAENRDAVDDIMGFLRPALLSFALIALLVAAFSIYNTFAIIVAQRTRESALLRAIGASRAQTLRAVLGESFLVGLVASVVGVSLGIVVATGLGTLLDQAGMNMPGGLVLPPGLLVTCVAIGTAMTVLCALGPAVRASRVTPIEALRDAAIDRTATSRPRRSLGLAAAAGSVTAVVWATVGSAGMSVGAVGVALAVLALVILGPVIAGPAGRVLGAPLRLRGVTGDLARQNAVRNPRRTASSSSALMIGVAIVALFTVLAASIKATLNDQVNRQFGGDLIVSPTVPVGLDRSVAAEIAALPQVAHAAGFSGATLTLDGRTTSAGAADVAQATALIDVDPKAGDLTKVTGESIAVSQRIADDRGWSVGTRLPYGLVDGTTGTLTVRAVYGETSMAGDYLVPNTLTVGHGAPATDELVLVKLRPGVSIDQGRRAVQGVIGSLPTAEVKDRAEFTEWLGGQVNTILFLVYGMLALSVVIALMGIANTLSLSTFERTRELGLLRAVGQGRRQTRAMVRLESVVIAVFGTAVGLAVGVLGAWVLVRADDSAEISVFTLPAGQLLAVLALGALAGVGAALRPAGRAAKLDPLTAIATG